VVEAVRSRHLRQGAVQMLRQVLDLGPPGWMNGDAACDKGGSGDAHEGLPIYRGDGILEVQTRA
jgi:hypothetical protein